jgi:hypothetical protein
MADFIREECVAFNEGDRVAGDNEVAGLNIL